MAPDAMADRNVAWTELEGWCPEFDLSASQAKTGWPSLSAVVVAAGRTELRRFWPFVQLHHLCFGTSPAFYLDDAAVIPVFIELSWEGPYEVRMGRTHEWLESRLVLSTADPKAAAEAASDAAGGKGIGDSAR